MLHYPAMTADLELLAERAWDDLAAARAAHPQVVPAQCAPVLFFGDEQAYRSSPLRIVTVGLNPSDREFPTGDPWRRFGGAQGRTTYLSALRTYFDNDPLTGWFSCFRELLRGLDASFHRGATNTALHTDLCSTVPTSPTWSRLPAATQQSLAQRGVQTWHDLITELRPDVIITSVRYAWLQRIRFERLSDWGEVHTVYRTNPYLVDGCELRLPYGSTTLLVRGRAANTPFGTVNNSDRFSLGQSIRRLL